MSKHATGSFEVKLNPEFQDEGEGATLARMSIDKQFSGDLDAHSDGAMLSAMTSTKGSAGYVAIERVVGVLSGRTGAFVLQHSGTMNRGEANAVITVVPDSGAGDLVGLSGEMKIIIEDGKHSYEFVYDID
jgi:hypothetical protein